MKKLLLLVIVAFLNCCILPAQDLIVTSVGDSLNARIIKLDEKKITYVYQYNGALAQSRKNYSLLKAFKSDFFPVSVVDSAEAFAFDGQYNKYRLAINGGIGFQLTHLFPANKTENNNVKGYNIEIEGNYFFSKWLGMGINYGFSRFEPSSNSNSTIHYITPLLVVREYTKSKRNAGIFSFGLGFYRFVDNLKYYEINNKEKIERKYRITGNTATFTFGIGYDIGLSKSFALGLQGKFVGALLRTNKVVDLANDETGTIEYAGSNAVQAAHLFNITLGLRWLK